MLFVFSLDLIGAEFCFTMSVHKPLAISSIRRGESATFYIVRVLCDVDKNKLP